MRDDVYEECLLAKSWHTHFLLGRKERAASPFSPVSRPPRRCRRKGPEEMPAGGVGLWVVVPCSRRQASF